MQKVQLSQSKVSIIDDIDEALNRYRWCYNNGYGVRSRPGRYGTRERVQLHVMVLERKLGRMLVRGEVVDHINHDRLDNRRANLRLATMATNQYNKPLQKNNSSGFKGIQFRKDVSSPRKYEARIAYDGKVFCIGMYELAEEAAWMRDQWAIALHGEFAYTNFEYQN
ncbi:HNH endonuclease [Arthrobacter sp. M-10]|uniref:HNH endonuclease n=1 Tax=Arthrobacter sp. M-10 TaxID=3233037 RepID=UPI003F9058B1